MPISRSSYYDERNRQGAALIRARRPYLVKNILTGVAIIAMEIGIYVYTMKAMSQDDFDDIEIPPPPQPMKTSEAIANMSSSKSLPGS